MDSKLPHSMQFFLEVQDALQDLSFERIDKLAKELVQLRERSGRLFVLGVGGSAANASHAVNDFRKLCHIEAYAPTDNVAELTARTNDEGWELVFHHWLDISNLDAPDALFILSVGGGNLAKGISTNLIAAIDLAKKRQAKVFGIVGRSDGYAAQHGDLVIVSPLWNDVMLTPLAESMQALIWHCLVCDPILQRTKTTW